MKTWKIVCGEEFPDDANNLTERLVIEIKDEGINREVLKALFVVQGHRHKFKKSFLYYICVAKTI